VASSRSSAPQAESPKRQRNVIDEDEQVVTGIETGKAAERRNGRSAPIHVGVGLQDGNREPLPAPAGLSGPIGPPKLSQLPAGSEPVGEEEPCVVPRVLVLRARIAEPHNCMQGSGFRFGLRFGVGLGLPNELGLARRRGFLHRRGSFLGPRGHHGTHRGIRVVEDLRLFHPDIPDKK
jgi:hypothetical protein